MADKMYIPNDCPLCNLKLVVEMFSTQLNKPTKFAKVPNVNSTNKKTLL